MHAQVSTDRNPASAVTPLSLNPQLDVSLAERQRAELHEAYLEHQVHPLGEIERRGVPYSALNE